MFEQTSETCPPPTHPPRRKKKRGKCQYKCMSAISFPDTSPRSPEFIREDT